MTYSIGYKKKGDKRLEEYVGKLSIPVDSTQSHFKEKFQCFYEPLFLTAENQGFEMNWKWKKIHESTL